MKDKIIAVDFDGTLCENAWPDIGDPIQPVIDYVLSEQANGSKLILWTNRHHERLEEAVSWCENHGITFNAVNENLPEVIEEFGGDTRKIFADEYIDDKATMPLFIRLNAIPNNQILEGGIAWEDLKTSITNYSVNTTGNA